MQLFYIVIDIHCCTYEIYVQTYYIPSFAVSLNNILLEKDAL